MVNNPEIGGYQEDKQFNLGERIKMGIEYIVRKSYVYEHPENYKNIKNIKENLISVNFKKKR